MGAEKLPWAEALFIGFLERNARNQRLQRFAHFGIRSTSKLSEYVEAREQYNELEGKKADAAAIAQSKDDAEFAQREIAAGMPFLFSIAAIMLWGSVEAFLHDLLVQCLHHDRVLLGAERAAKVRVSIAVLEALTTEERLYYLVTALERELPRPSGAPKFEAVFRELTLRTGASTQTLRDLFELQQVRNALLHRNETVDHGLASACPWLELVVGQPITITPKQLGRYTTAALVYSGLAHRVVTSHFGGSTSHIDNYLARHTGERG